MKISKHGTERLQQRGIPQSAIPLLDSFGTEYTQKGGSRFLFLNNRERKRVKKMLRRLLECISNEHAPYLILGDEETIITAGHLQKRPSKFKGY